MAEGIVARHFTDYDHFSPNALPENDGRRVSAEWSSVAMRMEGMNAEEIRGALNLEQTIIVREGLEAELASGNAEIARMLKELAEGLDEFCDQEDWACILGV